MMNDTLHSWQNFYFMAGGASATLLGLMFVALSLGMHLVNEENHQQIETFVSPSVFYFVSALMLCIIMLVPSYKPLILGGILLVCGGEGFYRMMGFVRAIVHAARQHQDFDITEWLTQAILPAASYTFILIAGGSFALQQYKLAFTLAALVTSLLLLSAIGNTWSLVLWIIEQRRD